tara:strand:- start:1025 stop:2212 length:1188 start_codon:yes stop_codon:yes gene_type:complete
MKKIKFLILFLTLSSCNQYLGTVNPDYKPTKEVTEIFSNVQNNTHITKVDFGDIVFPKAINSSLSFKNLKIDKITKTDRNSVVNFLFNKIILSKDKNIYLIDNKNEKNNSELMLNLNRDEKILYIFGYNDEIFLTTNRSRIFKIQDQNIIDFADFDVFTNTIPIVFDSNLIIFSVFGDIHQINLHDNSISKIDKFNLKPGISIKSNLFEDQTSLYYLINTGTLITFDKNSYEYYVNYLLEDLNILSSLGAFNELVDTPFSYNEHLYFLDRSGKIAVYNPVTSNILWELNINQTIVSYLFSNDGYLILMTLDKILTLSENGKIINSYNHNKESPISIFNIQEDIHLISANGISKINVNDKSEVTLYKNKFTSNLDIYYQGQNIYVIDDKSLFRLSE